MLDNDSSTPGEYTAKRYDLSLSNNTLSLSINVTSILSWVNSELDEYIQQNKIASIHDLANDWKDGRAFLCLAQRISSTDNDDATFETLIAGGDGEITTNAAADMRRNLAFSVFERELGLDPPSSTDPETPIPMYIAKVRHALQSLTINNDNDTNDPWVQQTHTVLDSIQHARQQLQLLGFHPSSSRDDTQKRHDPSMEHDTASNHAAIDDDDAHQSLSDMHRLERNATDSGIGRSRNTSGWEEDLAVTEQLLLDLHTQLDEYYSWADGNMQVDLGSDSGLTSKAQLNKRKALFQSVKTAHSSFQEYLEHDQQVLGVFRKRALFTQATAPIQQDLDWVQAEMLKTITTDTGIKELESRVHNAGILLHQLVQQYGEGGHQIHIDVLPMATDQQQHQQILQYASGSMIAANDPIAIHSSSDQQQQQQQQQDAYWTDVDALVKKYRLVHSWVADVRIWFVEAQRIQHWIGERIAMLESMPIPDAVSSDQLSITADEVEYLNTKLETLEKELEQFDKEDVYRLRKHVKDLTVDTAKEKDLSPADTTTIEITFTTLMTLDQLKHLLNRHSYTLEILNLRVFWENEYAKTADWVVKKMDELGDFIKSQARWQDDPGAVKNGMVESTRSKSTIIDKLLKFEVEVSTFDQGQFTTTVNLYQEMDDTSKVELPAFLESRQVDIEEKFEALVHRASFARSVVEQYLTMVDFMNSSERLLYVSMDGFRKNLVEQIDAVYSLFLRRQKINDGGDNGSWNATDDETHLVSLDIQPWVDELTDIQDQAVQLITETAGLILDTDTAYPLDQQENDTGNGRVQLAIKSQSSELIKFGESLEQHMNQYREALQWNTQLNAVYTNLQQLQTRIDIDTSMASRLVQDLKDTFGDQTLRLSETLIHDQNDSREQHLQDYKQKLLLHQSDYEKLDGDIQHILGLCLQSPTTVISTASDAARYLENDGKLVGAGLQNMATIKDHWESALCMMKERQDWEAHYHAVIQGISIHEQKAQHTQMKATWSADEDLLAHENTSNCMWDLALAQILEWGKFKDQSLPPLIGAFDKLVSGTSSSYESKWVTQHQRQDNLMVRVGQVDSLHSLVKFLVQQRKAITQFLIRAQDLRSQGTRYLNMLEASVLQHHMKEVSAAFGHKLINLDTYNKIVADIWEQWRSFDNDLSTNAIIKKQDNWNALPDLNDHCDSVKSHASTQYHELLSLAQSLKQWENVTKETNALRLDTKLWTDKLLSLNAQMMDINDSLVVKKDTLLTRLTLDHSIDDITGDASNDDSLLGGTNQQLEDWGRLIQQWQDHEFGLLDANRLELEQRMQMIGINIVDLGQDIGGNGPLDITANMDSAMAVLMRLQSQCETVAKPLLSLVHAMVETSNQRNAWNFEWIKANSYSNRLQGLLQSVKLNRKHWVQNIHTEYATDTMQHITESVTDIILDADTDTSQQLLDTENNAYMAMAQLYNDLCSHQMPDTLCIPVVNLPTELQSRHVELQQSIPRMHITLKQLETDTNWLLAGASWLKQVDGQFESWHTLMRDLVNFAGRDAKWTVDSNGTGDSTDTGMDFNATLSGLAERVNSLSNNVDDVLDEYQHWKLTQPDQECDIYDGAYLTDLKLWQQKTLQLENYRSDCNNYVLFASNLVDHRTKLQKWFEKVVDLEGLGNNTKTTILAENGDLGTTDLLQLVTDFDDKLTQLIGDTQGMNYPRPNDLSIRYMDTSTNSLNNNGNAEDDDTDASLQQFIHSRHEQLKEMSISLHFILDAKERQVRLRTLVDGYVAKASEALQWIKATNEKLQQVVSGDVADWDSGLLESKLGMIHDLKKSMDHYANAYYDGLKVSADSCIRTIHLLSNNKGKEGLDEANEDVNIGAPQQELERITNMQQQVDMDWKNLSDSLQQYGNDLKNALCDAERTYWGKQVMEKCIAVNDQLNSIGDDNLDTVTDEQLDQWQHTINEIKSVDLNHLSELFGSENLESLDDDSHIVLDSAKNVYAQLENRMNQIYLGVQHERQKSKYNDLTFALASFIDNTKAKLTELQAEFCRFSDSATLAEDEVQHDLIKVLWDSILGDWTGHQQMYEQEGELFLSTLAGVGEKTSIDQQHQQVLARWSELQHEIQTASKNYHVVTQQRPILDILHRASSILENVDDSKDDDAKQHIDRIQKLMTEASTSMKQHDQTESQTMAAGVEKGADICIRDIYQKRYDKLLERLETVEKEMQSRQQQRYIQQLQRQYQKMADKIKVSAEKEVLALEPPQPQDNGTVGLNSEAEAVIYGQLYQGWARKLELCEQKSEGLAQEAEILVDSMKTSGELGDAIMDELVSVYQGSLDKLENRIQHQQILLGLVRRILAHSKSADTITSWLKQFCKVLNGMTGDSLLANEGDSNHPQDEDINDLELKLQGFEPNMESLREMNKAIQNDNAFGDTERSVVLRWKKLTQDRFDKMESLWNESINALEIGKKVAIKKQNAITLARKINSLTSMMGDSRNQIEQLQTSLLTNGTLSADDEHHKQQNPLSLFKLTPRNRDITTAYDKVEAIEDSLMQDGQAQRMEIDKLIEQLDNDDSAKHFLQQQVELNAAWDSLMDTINKTKRSLSDEKTTGEYLGMVDEIDLLLDSMDEAVLKASPHYHATATDNEPSKAELQAKLIELNARNDYYKPKIEQIIRNADDYWAATMTDNNDANQDFLRLKATVMQHHTAQKARWNKLSDQAVPARQLELKKAIASSGVAGKMTRDRKSSLPTRKAAATLTPPSHPQSLHSTTSSRLRPPKTISTGLHPSSALTCEQRLRTVSSSSSLTSQDKQQSRLRQGTSVSASTSSLSTKSTKSTSSLSTKSTRSTSSTGIKTKAAAPVARKPPNSYVAQTGNALDVEIGRIVNEASYRVKVKMVPGEVGRYWFGDVNPKLVYCRVLKSKMVMVRVGGGWAELSQFLRDHAKLEGQLFIPKQEDQHLLHTTMKEGYLETTTSLQRQRKKRVKERKGQTGQHDSVATTTGTTLTVPTPLASTSSSSSIPIRSISKSTSSSKSSSLQQNGYKDGDKFIAVDRHGKQLEVKMTRFSQRSALPTATARRTKDIKS